jgi:hypothetical protein
MRNATAERAVAVAASRSALTVLNPATKKANVEVGVTAQLDLVLTNIAKDALTLRSGAAPSTLTVYPPRYFTNADIPGMALVPADTKAWHPGAPKGGALALTYVGPDNASWDAGASIKFSLTGVRSAGPAHPGTLQINPANIEGAPPQVSTPLPLEDAPQPGNLDLTKVLQVFLDQPARVYVSQPSWDAPLGNALLLTIMNTGTGDLYTDADIWTVAPKVTVKFVYGETAGALAPDTGKPPTGQHGPLGSAWNIAGKMSVDETVGWSIAGPNNSSQDPEPVWTLAPSPGNKAILGTGANAAVTFEFGDIVSFTPPGATQMQVQFTGFHKEKGTAYATATFVLGIDKQDPPDQQYGLWRFFSTISDAEVTSATQTASVPLRWAMFNIASVELTCSPSGIDLAVAGFEKSTGSDGRARFTRTYDDPQPLAYDDCQATISGLTQDTDVHFTLRATDTRGAPDAKEWPVSIVAPLEITSFTGALDQSRTPPVLTLSWKTRGGDNVELDSNIGDLLHTPLLKPITPSPTAPLRTQYTLTAHKQGKPDISKSIDLSQWDPNPVTALGIPRPGSLAISSDDRHLFVTRARIEEEDRNTPGPDSISVVDVSSREIDTSIKLPSGYGMEMVVSPGGGPFYLMTVPQISGATTPVTVWRIDPDAKTLAEAFLTSVPIATGQGRAVVTQQRLLLWGVDQSLGIVAFDQDGTRKGFCPSIVAFGAAPDGGTVYAVMQQGLEPGALYALDPDTLAVTKSVSVIPNSFGRAAVRAVTASPEGKKVFCVMDIRPSKRTHLYAFDAATLQKVGDLVLDPPSPQGVEFWSWRLGFSANADGGKQLVAGWDRGVLIIDPERMIITQRLALQGPALQQAAMAYVACSHDNTRLFVSDTTADQVLVFGRRVTGGTPQ